MALSATVPCLLVVTFVFFANLFKNACNKYSTLSVTQLKDELRKRKASVKGKKADLIERLESYDRNFNFGALEEDCLLDDDKYEHPPAEIFKDINASTALPPLSKHNIQEFIESFGGRTNAGVDLYEAGHLLTVRVAVVGDFTYLQGQCKASMKKMTYIANAKVNSAGEIQESHCECAAGSGVYAHCKHILVLLRGVEEMVRKKTITLHKVSTQKIMSFKRPKKMFYASPIQSQNMPNKRRKDPNFLPLQKKDLMGDYQSFVNNLVINYGDTTMPMKQLIRPANTFAVVWDHGNYCTINPKDTVLESLLLKNVNTPKLRDIEKNTRGQNNNPEWHKWRSCRITASNFHSVLHSKPATKQHLASKILNPYKFTSRATTHGKIHESIAIAKYCHMYDMCVEECGLFISDQFPYLGASPDGLLGEETVIEVKCPYTVRHCEINSVTCPFLEDINGRLNLKKTNSYYTQIQGQLFCANRHYCNLIVYTLCDMMVIYVNRDEGFITDMCSALGSFYNNFFEKAVLDKFLYKNYESLNVQNNVSV